MQIFFIIKSSSLKNQVILNPGGIVEISTHMSGAINVAYGASSQVPGVAATLLNLLFFFLFSTDSQFCSILNYYPNT